MQFSIQFHFLQIFSKVQGKGCCFLDYVECVHVRFLKENIQLPIGVALKAILRQNYSPKKP